MRVLIVCYLPAVPFSCSPPVIRFIVHTPHDIVICIITSGANADKSFNWTLPMFILSSALLSWMFVKASWCALLVWVHRSRESCLHFSLLTLEELLPLLTSLPPTHPCQSSQFLSSNGYYSSSVWHLSLPLVSHNHKSPYTIFGSSPLSTYECLTWFCSRLVWIGVQCRIFWIKLSAMLHFSYSAIVYR